MAYDRYDTRDPRDERSRWRGDRPEHGSSARGWDHDREDRGFFERAGDEVASWFGDDEAERRRQMDRMRDEREDRSRDRHSRDWRREEDRGRWFGRERDDSRGRFRDEDRWTPADRFGARRGSQSDRDFGRREAWGSRDVDRGWRDREHERGGYRPMTGDYGRGDHESEQFFAASGYGRG